MAGRKRNIKPNFVVPEWLNTTDTDSDIEPPRKHTCYEGFRDGAHQNRDEDEDGLVERQQEVSNLKNIYISAKLI